MSTYHEFQNIPALLQARVAEAPDKVFLFSEADGRVFTYSQFAAAVARTAALLSEIGIRKGDVVSLLLPNCAEYVIAYFACWKLGALAGPVNSLLKSQEITYVISNSEAKVLLVNSQFLSIVEPLREELTSLSAIIVFDNEIEATKEVMTGAPPESDISPDDEAIIIYTSGTTGKPKGCLLTHRNVIANASQISQWLGFGQSDRPVNHHAVVSHECGFSNNDVGALCGWIIGRYSQVFCIALLADRFRLSNNFIWFSCDYAFHAIDHLSERSAGGS
jgi:long-chain acyl-CoA synthetase